MEGYVAEAMHAGALGLSTGLEFKPGPRGADRRDRPPEQGRRPLRRATTRATSATATRPAGVDRRVPADHPRGRHEAARSRTSTSATAPAPRPAPGSARSTRCSAAREVEGLDVLADTTPFRDGLGQMVGILPPWVLADGWEEALQAAARPGRRASGCRHECDRYWRFIHRGEWHRVRLQASPQYPGLEGKDFHEIAARCSGTSEWDCYFDILAAAGPAIESILLIGELFTDEHLAEMISHPLFSLGVDGYTSALDIGLDGDLGPPGLLRRARALPHAPRPRARHAAARGGDPQDDEHAGRALRPAPTAGRSGRGYAADLVVLDLDRLADGSTLDDPLRYVEGVDEVLVNGAAVVSGGEHTGRPARAAPAARGDDRPPLRHLRARRRTRCGRRCARRGSAGRPSARTRT